MKRLRNTWMNEIIDWDIHIEHGYTHDPEVKVIDAVPGKYKVIFISCGSWEEAEKTKKKIEEGSL